MSAAVPSMTPYRFCFNNPVNVTDPTGLLESTDVTLNDDGSYTVVGAHNDGDNNVYVVDENGCRTGEVVAKTENPWDFLSTTSDGGFGEAVTGVTFDLNNLPSGDDLIDDYTGDFADKWDFGSPGIALARLAWKSKNGGEYDIKADESVSPQGSYTVFGYNGNYSGANDVPTITTARALGNIIFGVNMRTIYQNHSEKFPGGAMSFYRFVMPKVGAYNQRNQAHSFNEGFPFYGEHTYSGTYIYGGYRGTYR